MSDRAQVLAHVLPWQRVQVVPQCFGESDDRTQQVSQIVGHRVSEGVQFLVARLQLRVQYPELLQVTESGHGNRHRALDLGRTRRFDKEGARSCLPGTHHKVRCLVGSEHHHGGGALFRYLTGGLNAVHVPHANIHQDHVRMELLRKRDGLLAGRGLTDDLIVHLPENALDHLADQVVILDNQHSRDVRFLHALSSFAGI